MSVITQSKPDLNGNAEPEVKRGRRFGRTSAPGAFRALVSVHALLLLVMPVLSGLYLAGNFDALSFHEQGAMGILVLATIQFLLAAWLWRRGASPWPALVSLAIVLLESLQLTAGYLGSLALHVPLGVALFGASTALLLWVWRPAAPRLSASSSS